MNIEKRHTIPVHDEYSYYWNLRQETKRQGIEAVATELGLNSEE